MEAASLLSKIRDCTIVLWSHQTDQVRILNVVREQNSFSNVWPNWRRICCWMGRHYSHTHTRTRTRTHDTTTTMGTESLSHRFISSPISPPTLSPLALSLPAPQFPPRHVSLWWSVRAGGWVGWTLQRCVFTVDPARPLAVWPAWLFHNALYLPAIRATGRAACDLSWRLSPFCSCN